MFSTREIPKRQLDVSSVIRQKGDNQENKAQTNFPSAHVHTCAYQGIRNVSFSENLAWFFFLKHSFWLSPFCLITDGLMFVGSWLRLYNSYSRKRWSHGLVVRALGFPNQGSQVRNHRVTPRSSQPFVLPRSINWVTGSSRDLMVMSKLSSRSGSVALRQLSPIHKKGP